MAVRMRLKGGYTSTACLDDVGTKRTERPDLRNGRFTRTTTAYGDRKRI